jgi:hypothetical protein
MLRKHPSWANAGNYVYAGTKPSNWAIPAGFSAMIMVGGAFIFNIVIYILIIARLKATKLTLGRRTYDLHRTFVRILLIQVSIAMPY